jgi:hypothetical protein
VFATGNQDVWRLSLGTRMNLLVNRPAGHALDFGVDLDRAVLRTSDQFTGTIGESVDDIPARAWLVSRPGASSKRHATTFAAFASSRVPLTSSFMLDAAVRFEAVNGRADGATTGINWLTLLPRAGVRWEFATRPPLAVVGGYRRTANRLNLDILSFGDPAAPTATVLRWLGGPLSDMTASNAVVIDRVGPGTGGDPAFTRIDPDLKRPLTDEYVAGVESNVIDWLRLGFFGIARRETIEIANVDIGVPIDGYSTFGIPDPGWDFFSAEDDQVLTIYNRLPSTFGRNQYLLTNPDQQAASTLALKFTADGATDRLFMHFGATASVTKGSARNRGHLPIENDQQIPGELFTNPNAATHARGRLFADRNYTIKWTTTYRFPADVRVGAIARYQDGQPFSRFVIASTLNQGAEAVRAFTNGQSRFTFTGTLDLRIQKRFAMGTRRADAFVDFYNLLTRGNEVEEDVVTGPEFRTSTAIQPPRSVHVGLRVVL